MARHANQAAALLAHLHQTGSQTTAQLTAAGFSASMLTRMVHDGRIQRVARGVYTLPNAPFDPHMALVEACARVPQGVVCLLSALAFHGIGSQQPRKVWLGLPRGYRPPKDMPLHTITLADWALHESVAYPHIQKIIDDYWDLTQNIDAPIDTLKLYNEEGIWNTLYPKHHKNEVWKFVNRHPETPNVLIMGNSISIGYTQYVRKALGRRADVCRVPVNCAETRKMLKNHKLWLGDGDWDVIHFNWGLHDLKRLTPEGKLDKSRKAGNLVPVEEYKENLEKIIQILKKTEATLIFATTTIVPPEAAGRIVGDELIYNAAAMEVLRNHPEVIIDDQYTAMKNFPEGRRELKDVHHFPWGQAKLGYQAGDLIREVLKKEGKW